MSCEDVVRQLSDYIDGALPPADRAELEHHLATCHDCHVVLDTTQCTILLYRAARSRALEGERRRLLLEKLQRACRGCGGAQPNPPRRDAG
ncbi:MAG TPA: zf-HC2 domain-containing protein [Vicinamibacteria bacterium]|nr:zf-HC2 domain-containing protein [Vicinamibacteria bacterium]